MSSLGEILMMKGAEERGGGAEPLSMLLEMYACIEGLGKIKFTSCSGESCRYADTPKANWKGQCHSPWLCRSDEMDFDDDDEYDKEFLTRRVSFLQSRRLVCDGLPAKHLPRELPRCVFVVEVGPAREEAEAALAELPGSITSALDTATGLSSIPGRN
ncbi:hypothetical protein H4Q26_001246 [Puccinia striiformis f. sp. tritici PST-130]|nr:hypothetical protein H4Q26_001246 [Puccinia striiformis f. sp. tritici PST-130]